MRIKKIGNLDKNTSLNSNASHVDIKSHFLFWLALFSLIILFVFTYRNIFSLFYQQDEWFTLGQVISKGISNGKNSLTLFEFITGRERPFSIPIQTFFYSVFQFNTLPFALFSLFFHSLNSALVGLICYQLTKKHAYAFFSIVFFLINQQSQQALTWFAANTTTLPSLTCGLFALWFILIGKGNTGGKWFVYAQISAICAYMFKESAISIMILLPIILIKPIGSYTVKQCIKIFWILIIYIAFVVISRTTTFGSSYLSTPERAYQSLSISSIIVRAVWYPLVSVSQQFIPQGIMFRISGLFQTVMYEFMNGTVWGIQVAQTVIADMFSIIASGIILFIVYVLYKNKTRIRPLIVTGLYITFFSFLPFSVLSRANSYLDSRYFYMSSVGGAFLFASIIGSLWFSSKWKILGRLLTMFFITIYLGINSFYINKSITLLQSTSEERIHILSSIQKLYRTLPKKVLIYSEGSSYGYYAIPELKWPFQQGVGFTLMTWFYKNHTIPSSFIREGFLWDILSEGYQEENNMGFGYVRNKALLSTYISKYNLTAENIIGIYYDDKSKSVIDISNQVRKEMFPSYEK